MPRLILAIIETRLAYGRNILEGLIHHVRHREHGHVLHDFRPRPALEAQIAAGRVHGIVAELRDSSTRDWLRRMAVPTVIVTGLADERLYPSVIADNAAVGRLAFDHLQSLGLQCFAFLGWHGSYYSDTRRDAFCHAARAAGYDAKVLGTVPTAPDRFADLGQHLATLKTPVGLFAATDYVARDAALVCGSLGLRVPEDVAILGVDNDELICEASIPPLSSIDNGTRQIGIRAGELLDQLIDGHPPPSEPVAVEPVSVVSRQSTDVVAVDHPGLAAALRFIRDHAARGIRIEDVLQAVPMSRRSLEIQCRECLGRSPQQEITRVQVEHARTLLLSSTLPTPDIAARCGFSSASQLSVVFKRETGMTPTTFRRRHG